MKEKISLKNIFYYLQGKIRYKLFYSKFIWIIPTHIVEQITARIFSMRKECYNNGECIMCGCQTTALQMANKACQGKCYPRMLTKKDWRYFKKNKIFTVEKKLWRLTNNNTKFKLINELG